MWRAIFPGGVAVLLCAHAFGADAPGQRPVTVDDLLALDGLPAGSADCAFAPNQPRLAIVRYRPRGSLSRPLEAEFLHGNEGGDIWVQDRPGQPLVAVTDGAADGSSWWYPQWSPDGRRLALLSTRGGPGVVWLWDVETRALTQLTRMGVARAENGEPVFWIDDHRLVVAVLPDDTRMPNVTVFGARTIELAARGWTRAAAGKESSASEMRTGSPAAGVASSGQLLLLDISSGQREVLCAEPTTGWRLTPDGSGIAFGRVVRGFNSPASGQSLSWPTYGTYAAEIRFFDGRVVRAALPKEILASTLRWSPDGKSLAGLCWAGTRDDPPRVFRWNGGKDEIDFFRTGTLDTRVAGGAVEWTSDGQLMVRATIGAWSPGMRADWHIVDTTAEPRCLTRGWPSVPSAWLRSQTGLLCVASGALCRLEVGAARLEPLWSAKLPAVTGVVWPVTQLERRQFEASPTRMVLDSATGPLQIDLTTGEISSFQRPSAAALPVAFAPPNSAAIYAQQDRRSSTLWRVTAQGNPEPLISTNLFLSEIAEGEFREFTYSGKDGQTLPGLLLLPVGYVSGRRYPLITVVYPTRIVSERERSRNSIFDRSPFLNMQLAAAAGYAVLFPSMPPGGPFRNEQADFMLELPNGVLPAVDRAIELGVADPERLCILGHSYGGFAALGLVAQTTRFRAAIALNGISDLVSFYGGFDPTLRYEDHYEKLTSAGMWLLETDDRPRIHAAPWQDLARYLRNSPLLGVEQVQTPVMLVGGDMDFAGLQQGEEFFTALHRLGKEGAFVRYWGEGHVLRSAANLRDLWSRMLAWCDHACGVRRDAQNQMIFGLPPQPKPQ